MARDLGRFYSRGMKIWTCTESADGLYKSEWQLTDNDVEVISFNPNDLVRTKSRKKKYACGRTYNTLKFTCTFPEVPILRGKGGVGSSTAWPGGLEDNNIDMNDEFLDDSPVDEGVPGTVFCFAYALPYTYSDLMSDLENSKKFLIKNGGIIRNEKQKKAASSK